MLLLTLGLVIKFISNRIKIDMTYVTFCGWLDQWDFSMDLTDCADEICNKRRIL